MKYSSKYELLTIFGVYVNIIYMNSIPKTKFKTKLCEVEHLKTKILKYDTTVLLNTRIIYLNL